ncbi:MAG: alanine dehydrogenase, partial [Candidatus Deferrimicrobiaceae bacterium]
MKLRIGIPREIKEGENRIATTPRCVRALRDAGARVFVQKGAGLGSGFPDTAFAGAGATIVSGAADAWRVDLVVKVKEPLPREFRFLSERTALFTYLHLAAFPELTEVLLARKVTAIGYETVRKGGRLILLRPMSEVAGILAIQVGARGLEKASGG